MAALDTIELKKSGLSEKTIQAIIFVTGKKKVDIQRERALRSMEIHIETK